MTVPIVIPWDLYQGKLVVWCEAVAAGARRAVLLPRLDTVFSPVEEDPARERPYASLDWRLISPREQDWTKYREMVEKQVARYGIRHHIQRVESVAEWVQGRKVVVPQYHLWLYREEPIAGAIGDLYAEPDPRERQRLWRELLAWQAPAPLLTEED
ncbi:MAG TPA: hypothetical protein VMM12_07520 [Longimicrobiales bacterium]|nr:hypothetical protein [Longimicrobiales bacterium]